MMIVLPGNSKTVFVKGYVLMTVSPQIRGILLTIVAAMSFGCIPLFAKVAYANGFNPFSFSLFRSLFTAVAIFFILKMNKKSFEIEKKQMVTLFKASFFGYFLMMITLFMSYNYMATGLATTAHFVYPVATMAGAVMVYREKMVPGKAAALAVSLLGIYFLAGFDSIGSFSMTGFSLAFVSGLFYAYYVLAVSYGNIKKIDSFVQVFYISLFNTATLLLVCLVTDTLSFHFTGTGLISTVLVALVSTVFGMVAFQAGLKIISPTAATILSTFEVLTSLVIGTLFLNETLTWYQCLGSLLIVFSVIVVALSEITRGDVKGDIRAESA